MAVQKHILVADDDAPLRFFASRILTYAGYQVSEATDARLVHLMVLAASHNHAPYDLLLVNTQMLLISGEPLFQELALLENCPPLLLLRDSLCAPSATTSQTPFRGALIKPFTQQALLETVAHALAAVENRSTLALNMSS